MQTVPSLGFFWSYWVLRRIVRFVIGTTVAHYQITSKLGQGGMGEVWLATDTSLDRQVALKMLPVGLAQDRERLARFEREAKVLAQLSHANIAAVHGFGQHEGIRFLVMEYLAAEDLSLRLLRGPLPVDESLSVAKKIAEALEVAHCKGIVHRDLKPANIKLGEDGELKVLDFGLAKALSEDSDSSPGTTAMDDSPTITDVHTNPGAILGTAAYMSPEQAKGKAVDKRSDIWAFGCVLFECLTGKKPFAGEDATDTLAAILRSEPDWSLLPSELPSQIQFLLRKCLAKGRKQRLHEIADARVDLELAMSLPAVNSINVAENSMTSTVGGRRLSMPVSVGITFVACVLTGLGVWMMKPVSDSIPSLKVPKEPIRRVKMELGYNGALHLAGGNPMKFSPDGSMLGFVSVASDSSGEGQIFLRRLDQLDAIPLAGARPADQFCFSPDGQWIAFRDYEEGWIKKVKITGGPLTNLCRAEDSVGMDWGANETIVFGSRTGGLRLVPDTGGESEILTQLEGREITHRWPEFLPGREEIVFVTHGAQGSFSSADIWLHRPSGERTELIHDAGTSPRYLESGQLIYRSGHRLLSITMDPKTLKIVGNPKPLEEGVARFHGGVGGFDVSSDVGLIFVGEYEREYSLDWVDRDGNPVEFLPEGFYHSFSVAPDGSSVAFSEIRGGDPNLWRFNLNEPSPVQLTHDVVAELFPVWSPDGAVIVYSIAGRRPMPALGLMRADGVGEPKILIENETFLIPLSWHPSGKRLLVHRETDEGDSDLLLLHLNGDSQNGWTVEHQEAFLESGSRLSNGFFSPDGDWVTNTSNESLRPRLFVRRMDGMEAVKVIPLSAFSLAGVSWSDPMSELIFSDRAEGQSLVERQVFGAKYRNVDGSIVFESPQPWPGSQYIAQEGGVDFAFDPKGDRVLVRRRQAQEDQSKLNHVVWVQNVAQLVGE